MEKQISYADIFLSISIFCYERPVLLYLYMVKMSAWEDLDHAYRQTFLSNQIDDEVFFRIVHEKLILNVCLSNDQVQIGHYIHRDL